MILFLIFLKIFSQDWKHYKLINSNKIYCYNLTTECAYYVDKWVLPSNPGYKKYILNIPVSKCKYTNSTCQELETCPVVADSYEIGCNFTCDYYRNFFSDNDCNILEYYRCELTYQYNLDCTNGESITEERIEEVEKNNSNNSNILNFNFYILLIIIFMY